MISGIKLEFSRASHAQRGGAAGVYRRSGGLILQVLGDRIKKRVSKRGDVAGQPVAAYPTGPPIAVNPNYPVSGGKVREDGLRVFESSRELHRTTRLGTFWVTGGMWSGMSVVVGTKTSVIRFRGRSHGQESKVLRYRFRERVGGKALFDVARRSRAKIPNARKAAAVFTSRGISLLALSQQELGSLTGALLAAVVRSTVAVGPAAVTWQGVVTDKMTREVFKRLRR